MLGCEQLRTTDTRGGMTRHHRSVVSLPKRISRSRARCGFLYYSLATTLRIEAGLRGLGQARPRRRVVLQSATRLAWAGNNGLLMSMGVDMGIYGQGAHLLPTMAQRLPSTRSLNALLGSPRGSELLNACSSTRRVSQSCTSCGHLTLSSRTAHRHRVPRARLHSSQSEAARRGPLPTGKRRRRQSVKAHLAMTRLATSDSPASRRVQVRMATALATDQARPEGWGISSGCRPRANPKSRWMPTWPIHVSARTNPIE